MTVANVKTTAGWLPLQKVGPQGPPGYDTAPIGSAIYWTGTDGTVPTEWALANGQRLTRALFPDAYAYAKVQADAGNPLWTYRVSDETFTVPNFADKFIYGKGSKGLGAGGGEEQHTLILAELASHGHTGATTDGATPDHLHGAPTINGNYIFPSSSYTVPVRDGASWSDATGPTGSFPRLGMTNAGISQLSGFHAHTASATGAADRSLAHGHNLTVGNQGGDASHNNMPPYVVSAIIVKVRGVSVAYGAIIGPSGPQGVVGPAGPTGPTGVQGVRGPAGTPQRVTVLPSGPLDGDEIVFVADAANGVLWHLRCNAASASPYKWEFVGGAPLFSEVAASQSVSVSAYSDLTTPGPAVTLPLSGDYIVAHGARMYSDQNNGEAWMSYAVGATAASDVDGINHYNPSAVYAMAEAMERRRNSQTGVTLTAKYRRGAAGAASFEKRWMRATPVRVG